MLAALGALSVGARAQAQELSARPTLFAGANRDGDFDTLQGGLHLGLTGRTAEFGAGFTLEAQISVLALATDVHWRGAQTQGPGFLGGGQTGQFNQFYDGVGLAGSQFQFLDNSSFVRLAWRPGDSRSISPSSRCAGMGAGSPSSARACTNTTGTVPTCRRRTCRKSFSYPCPPPASARTSSPRRASERQSDA